MIKRCALALVLVTVMPSVAHAAEVRGVMTPDAAFSWSGREYDVAAYPLYVVQGRVPVTGEPVAGTPCTDSPPFTCDAILVEIDIPLPPKVVRSSLRAEIELTGIPMGSDLGVAVYDSNAAGDRVRYLGVADEPAASREYLQFLGPVDSPPGTNYWLIEVFYNAGVKARYEGTMRYGWSRPPV